MILLLLVKFFVSHAVEHLVVVDNVVTNREIPNNNAIHLIYQLWYNCSGCVDFYSTVYRRLPT